MFLDDPRYLDRGFPLRVFERVFACSEVADHLEHEWSRSSRSIVALGGCRRAIPIPSGGECAIGVDRKMLTNIGPAIGSGMVIIHLFLDSHRADLVELGMAGPIGMVPMNLSDLPHPSELTNAASELVNSQDLERRWHRGETITPNL